MKQDGSVKINLNHRNRTKKAFFILYDSYDLNNINPFQTWPIYARVGIHKRNQAQVEPKNQLNCTAVYNTKLELIFGST